jgi:hypothetical protein
VKDILKKAAHCLVGLQVKTILRTVQQQTGNRRSAPAAKPKKKDTGSTVAKITK